MQKGCVKIMALDMSVSGEDPKWMKLSDGIDVAVGTSVCIFLRLINKCCTQVTYWAYVSFVRSDRLNCKDNLHQSISLMMMSTTKVHDSDELIVA